MLSPSPRLSVVLSATLGLFFFSWCRALVDTEGRLGGGVPRCELGRMPRRAFPSALALPAPLDEPSREKAGGVGLPVCPYLFVGVSVPSRAFTRRIPDGSPEETWLRT